MSNKNEEANIRCPFYLRSSAQRICCEGYIKGTCMITSFPDKKSAAIHMQTCCFLADGGHCQFARMLYDKYEKN
ncbi:MAG: hypothetical protein IJO14_01410 [Clostridia bacterium]|nr:hypothetical protein [Clostridia bacterium]